MPRIAETMNRFRREVQQGENEAVRLLANRWVSVNNALRDDIERTAAELSAIHRAGREPTRHLLMRNQRFQTLLAQTQREIKKASPQMAAIIEASQARLVRDGIIHAEGAIRAVAGVNLAFNRLPVAAVENMVGLTADGSPLRELLERSYGEGADGILNEMTKGVALGLGPGAIARRVIRRGLSRSLDRMLLINRTETLRVYREASRQAYEASKIVRGYRRICSKSLRTCAGCLAADGAYYELNESFAAHPRCRCSLVPVVIGAPVPTWQTGLDWLEKQPEKTQRSILGRGRYEAYRTGKFNLSQLASVRQDATWGDSVYATPLKDLLAGRGGINRPVPPLAAPAPTPAPKPGASYVRPSVFDEFDKLPAPDDLSVLTWIRNLPEDRQPIAVQQYRAVARKFIDANRRAAESVKAHGLRKAIKMYSFDLDGVSIYYTSGTKDAAVDTLIGWYGMEKRVGERIPTRLWQGNERIYFVSARNKDDSFWAKTYKMPNFRSAATGGDGGIMVYGGDATSTSVLAHESGHNLAKKLYGSTRPPATSDYGKIIAAATESPVTDYAAKSDAEDFAETAEWFVTRKSVLEKNHPDRYRVFNDIIEGNSNG